MIIRHCHIDHFGTLQDVDRDFKDGFNSILEDNGTGKSTHARLWRETFGDRVWMINDDKPLLRIESEGAGSPAEINLKAQDIVNMGMARKHYVKACVGKHFTRYLMVFLHIAFADY